MADPITLSPDDVEIAPSLSADDVEIQAPQVRPEVQRAIQSVPRPQLDYMQTERPLTGWARGQAEPTPVSPEAVEEQKTLAEFRRSNQLPVQPRDVAGAMAQALTAPSSGGVTAEPSIGPEVSQSIRRVQTPGERVKGVLGLTDAALQATTPVIGPAALDAPISTALGFGEGYVAGKGAKKIAKTFGATPETQNLAESVGQMTPVLAHAVLRPEIGIQTPETTGDTTAVSAGVRGGGAGVAVTPEATVLRAKVGPFTKEIRIPRKGAQAAPALEPQTIEGELAKNPPTRDEIADAQAETNYESPEATKQRIVEKRAQKAAQTSAGDASPSGPEGAKPAGVVEKTPTPAGTPAVQPAAQPTIGATPERFKPIVLNASDVEIQTPERRQNVAERKRVEHMTPDEMKQELLTSKQTGLPNRRAFDEAEKSPAVAMSDADGLKAFNDKFGYEAGNALLQAKADALREAGLDSFHDKGDEFLHRGASADELNTKLEKARQILRDKEFIITNQDGSKERVKGVDFSYGTGKDLAQAESGLKTHKSEREARGERARGELPGITQTPEGVDRKGGAGEVSEVPRSEVEVQLPPEEQYKHRSTQVNIPTDSEAHTAIKAAQQRIAKSDLMAEAGGKFGGASADSGVEASPHVTVRYGLTAKDDADLSKLKQYIASLAPFEASLGKTEKFPPSESSDGAAVIHAPVEATELHQMNKEMEKHAPFSKPTFDEYKPHATIAYVKPERADRYVGMSVTHGKKFKVNEIAITDRSGNQDVVKLQGMSAVNPGQKESSKAAPVKGSAETTETSRVTPGQPETTEKDYPAAASTSIEEAKRANAIHSFINAVAMTLQSGESLGNVTELTKLAEQHFGSSRVSGQWTPKDMFDAMEAGVNKYLLKRGKALMEMPAEKALAELKDLESRLTSQGTRTEEQIKAQQFSTPPRESFVAAKVAALKPSDVVLEPSAGNGGIAVWPKAIGAEVHVNEIAERRQKMLEAAGFGKPTAHDGELINALLDRSIKPTVVLMNPPFSSAVTKSNEGPNRNLFGFNHVDQALQRLQPNGRLVAILGGGQANEPNGGASLTGGRSGEWFKKVASQHHIRANVRVNGKEYQKYGTAFATRIIVIDKDGPMTPDRWLHVVTKNVDTLEEAYNALSKVASSRPQLGGSNVTARSEGEVPTAGSRSPQDAGQLESPSGSRAPSPAGESGHGVPGGRSPEAARPVQPPDRSDRPDRSAGDVRPEQTGQRVPLDESASRPAEPPQAASAADIRRPGQDADQERPVQQPEVEGLTLGREKQDLREQEDSSAYVSYRPTLKGPAHPGNIVESKAMATVPLPEIIYKPSLPDSVIANKKLSAVQLEAISIAGQQNDIVLPSGHRASALIGDGTGVGKGRIAAGILWDNYRKGRKRLVWVSEKWDLMEDAKRDFNGIGAIEMSKNIKAFQKYDVKTPIDHEGVIFTTYALIRSGDSKGNTRVAQLERWLRGNDEAEGAYVLFDESHNLKNAVVGEQGIASEIGKTVRGLLDRNPKLRTASESATAATDVMNLGYLDRLGLWGAGTSFPNGFGEFAAQISGGGISAMEMVARELKAQGKYLSRTLSYKGVTYQEVEHKLSDEQKELYRTATKAWASVVQDAEDTIKKTTNGGGRQVSRFLALFYGAQLRFFNVLLTTLKIPTVIEDTQKALAEGKSVVITLVNTNEAAQNREKNKEQASADDADEPPDYDFGAAEMLVDLVRQHYPTQQYADDVDANGNLIKVPVVDGDGNPVHNPEAERRRDELIDQVKRDLKLPANPLDILIDSLGGTSKVAELTGRKERYDQALGKFIKRGDAGVKRDSVNLSEMAGFQAGKKRIAILSNAAGTGISLHAGEDVKNQQKRHHITLQMGWSADKAMQMLGRTHRANQVQPPEYNTIVSDLGGEKRFSATIAKRLGSLGALSKGQRSAINSSDAMEKVNFESEQGRKAANTFYERLLRNADIPGTDIKGFTILRDLRVLKVDPKTGQETVPRTDRTNVTRLLNRLLALDPDVQNAVYDYYYDIFQATVEQAMEAGELDTGVKELPGDSFRITGERSIARDPKTGAETYYYPVEAQVRTDRMPAKRIHSSYAKYKDHGGRILRNKNGKLFFAYTARPIVHADGRTEQASYVVSPDNGVQRKMEDWRLHEYEDVTKAPAEKVAKLEKEVAGAENTVKWAKENYPSYLPQYEKTLANYQQQLAEAKKAAEDPITPALKEWDNQYTAAPDHQTKQHHLIGGAVLRWWNQIKEAAEDHLNIFTTVDSKTGKRVVGVEVPGGGIQKLLDRITGSKSTVSAQQMQVDVLLNGLSFDLERGIKVKPGRVGRDKVVQLVPPNQDVAENLKRLGAIYERGMVPIYYVPVQERPSDTKPRDILEKILENYPVQDDTEAGGISNLHRDESGTFTPSRLNPLHIREQYRKAAEEFISGKLKIGDKYYDVAKADSVVADTLHLVDNAPRYFREKATANLKKVLAGLNEDQVRLASLMVDSDSRDYLIEHKPDEYEKAINDHEVMAAVNRFKPLQVEMTEDRIALRWPVRRSMEVHENPNAGFGEDPWMVTDRDGNPLESFKTRGKAERYVVENAEVEPHLKRTYPEHMRSPLPMETGKAPYTGSFYADKGLRPPGMDKKSRLKSAEYHYEHGAKDFSGYTESFVKTKEAVLKQNLFDDFSNEATKWIAGTAQPPEIEYNDETYYRPDIALQMRKGGEKNVKEYSDYDPSKGERFLIKAMPTEEEQGWSTLSTGKPGIGPQDRFLGPKVVVDAMERYDKARGGTSGPIRRFFQEQIVGLFGPAVHVNNILRRVGQATGTGTFDPRSWPSLAKVILSPELRDRVMKGVDDDTIDLLVQRGAYTDWSDIGNLNRYWGGNLNPLSWIRAFGKGVLFDPKFMGGWGGLDPKARIVIADYFKEHYPEMSSQEIADAVNDGLGNYNRANWTERQRMIAKFTLFPGWDTGSFKWFIRHPFITAIAPALVILAINMALKALGKNKGDDWTDMTYIHWGDRKLRSGLLTDSMAQSAAQPILSGAQAYLRHEDVDAGATEGAVRGFSNLMGTLAGPTVQMIANQVANREFGGGASEIVKPEDKYTPGTWMPNVELEKRTAYTFLKGLPALNRFMSPDQKFDWMQGMGSIVGVTNYKYGAEERLRGNVARSMELSKTLSELSERDPEAAGKFVENTTNAAYLTLHGDLEQMARDLKDMDKAKQEAALANIPESDRKTTLGNIEESRKQLLTSADALNDLLVRMKMQKPQAVAAAR
jgi:GGDEF domain-containing protein/2'-5' RNA ligase